MKRERPERYPHCIQPDIIVRQTSNVAVGLASEHSNAAKQNRTKNLSARNDIEGDANRGLIGRKWYEAVRGFFVKTVGVFSGRTAVSLQIC